MIFHTLYELGFWVYDTFMNLFGWLLSPVNIPAAIAEFSNDLLGFDMWPLFEFFLDANYWVMKFLHADKLNPFFDQIWSLYTSEFIPIAVLGPSVLVGLIIAKLLKMLWDTLPVV